MSLTKTVGAAVALSLTAQPAGAAAATITSYTTESRTAAFAGVQLRLPIGQGAHARPTARLQLSSAYYTRQQSGSFVQSRKGSVLELGADNGGKPALFINGHQTRDIQQKVNMSGTTKTVLIVGGVLLVAVVVLAAVASASPTPGPHEGAFD
jgi:hypothetical protein